MNEKLDRIIELLEKNNK
ncbi:hypothetical protein [Methanothermococcus thermolithotrophicus]